MKKKPADLYYSENHLWLRLEENKEAVLGVTDQLLTNWHEIIHLDLPKKGKAIKGNTPFGEIESSDNLITLTAPLNGKVLMTNAACLKNPHLILTSPYDNGWLIRIKLTDISELNTLMDYDEYEDFIAETEEETADEDSFDDDEF